MEKELSSDQPPENNLTDLERLYRVSRFKDLADEFGSIIAAGGRAKDIARILLRYVKPRLKLLEWEQNRAALVARADWIDAPPLEYPLLRPLKDAIRRLLSPLARDATKNMVPYWDRKIARLVKKIAPDAAFVDRLLFETGLDINDELRPYSCLPHGGTEQDTAIVSQKYLPGTNASASAPPQNREMRIEPLPANTGQRAREATGIDTPITDSNFVIDVDPHPDTTLSKDIDETTIELPPEDDADNPWLDLKQRKIRVLGKDHCRNGVADAIAELKNMITPKQLDAAILKFGYSMSDTHISHLLKCDRKSIYDRVLGFKRAVDNPPLKEEFNKLLKRP